jgi:hypothetical protein
MGQRDRPAAIDPTDQHAAGRRLSPALGRALGTPPLPGGRGDTAAGNAATSRSYEARPPWLKGISAAASTSPTSGGPSPIAGGCRSSGRGWTPRSAKETRLRPAPQAGWSRRRRPAGSKAGWGVSEADSGVAVIGGQARLAPLTPAPEQTLNGARGDVEGVAQLGGRRSLLPTLSQGLPDRPRPRERQG